MDNSWNVNEHFVDIEVYEYMKMQNKIIECDICKKEFSIEVDREEFITDFCNRFEDKILERIK